MAFSKEINPEKSASAKNKTEDLFLVETDNPTPVGNLFPEEKAIEKAFKKDASSADAQKTIGADKAKQIMLSLRTLSPLIIQFLQSEKNLKTSDQKRTEWLNSISLNRKNATTLAQLITPDAEKPKYKWLLGMCQRFIAEIESSMPDKSIDWNDSLFQRIIESMENDIKEQKFTKLSSNVHVKIALVKSVGTIFKCLEENDLKHKKTHIDTNLKTIMDKMVFSCVDAIESLVSPLTPEGERHILFGVLMDEASLIMSRTIKDASLVMSQTLINLEKKTGNKEKAVQELMLKRPEGYPVDSLLNDFSKKFVKLINVSKHYHPSK